MPISRISSVSSFTREMRLMGIKAHRATLFNMFIFFVLNTPLPLASSAAALRFASGIAQVDGCTRVLSYNNQLSEMLRSAFLRIYFPRQRYPARFFICSIPRRRQLHFNLTQISQISQISQIFPLTHIFFLKNLADTKVCRTFAARNDNATILPSHDEWLSRDCCIILGA